MPNPAAVTWLSTADMAVRFRTSEGTIRYWRYSGTGPPGTLFGKRVLYRLSDVQKWEREHERAERSGAA